MYELTVRAEFAAAHKLEGHTGHCSFLHGHTWLVEVTVSGDKLDQAGMLLDFQELKKLIQETLSVLDHKYLNELYPFQAGGQLGNPTAENLARYIFKEIELKLKESNSLARLAKVSVWESPVTCASYYENSGVRIQNSLKK